MTCFLCHNTVDCDTTEEIRDKYREIVGMNLCPDTQLCYICRHMLNKLWLFKSICFKRSLEYPVLFREKGTINLQNTDIATHIICSEEFCSEHNDSSIQYVHYTDNEHIYHNNSNEYVELEDNDHTYHNDSNEYVEENDHKNDILNDAMKLTGIESNDEIHNGSEGDMNKDDDDNCQVNTNDEIGDDIVEDTTEVEEPQKKKKSKKSKKKDFEKIILSLEEQKHELESQRRSKKYLEAEFKCYNCGLPFLFKDTYQTHMMRHEESNGEYRCVTCTLRFASPSVLRSHRALHSERYKCTTCGTSLRVRQKQTHARRCYGRVGEAVACHLCGNVFQEASGLQQHLKRFHMTKTSSRTYPCSVCGKTYNNQAAVRTHMIKHIHKKFACDQCGSTFSSPYTLNQHKLKHSLPQQEGNQFYCVTCNVGYSSRKSWLAHRRNALNHQQRSYECPVCNRVCPNQKALASHMSTVHSSTKDFECPTCPAKYTSRKSLVRHMGTHSQKQDVQKAICHLCGRHFKSKSKLTRHLREVCEKDKLEQELTSYYEQHLN